MDDGMIRNSRRLARGQQVHRVTKGGKSVTDDADFFGRIAADRSRDSRGKAERPHRDGEALPMLVTSSHCLTSESVIRVNQLVIPLPLAAIALDDPPHDPFIRRRSRGRVP